MPDEVHSAQLGPLSPLMKRKDHPKDVKTGIENYSILLMNTHKNPRFSYYYSFCFTLLLFCFSFVVVTFYCHL